MNYRKILEELVWQIENYYKVHRYVTNRSMLDKVKDSFGEYEYEPHDNLIRETLMEHVGSTPVVAMFLHIYLDDKEVDLGRALQMLAIHDIGELIVGDELTFTKKHGNDYEKTQALKILPREYHDLYLEYGEMKSKTALFARAVDKITPDIFDLINDSDTTKLRYKTFMDAKPNEVVDILVKHKLPYMLWNNFMSEFYAELCREIGEKLE
jgi:5'-deoxynucleotidase YfbR-like HD superfamily hydrolase